MFACQEAKKDDSKTTQTEQVEKFTPETFSETDIPENIKKQEKAKIIGGVKWKDKQGSFLLILVEIPLFKKLSKESLNDSINQVEAQAYLFKNGTQIQKYLIVESHKVFDIDAKFIKEATTVVDSDKNDIGEATFLIKHYMYVGAVVPSQLKLITFTDESKYEMEGTISSKILNYKGSIDKKNFTNAPAPILAQAKQIWEKFWEEKQ